MSTLKVNTIQNTSGVEVFTAKAWVNFNGQGTVAIRSAGNVSSITDLGGAGAYTINFASNMPDANYAVACMCTDDSSSNRGINLLGNNTNMTVSGFKVNVFVNTDPTAFCAIVFR
jgi:hypothetical protein